MSTAKTEILNVEKVEHVADYKLRIDFNDGHQSVVDFEPFLSQSHHPAIRRYLDQSLFLKWSIDYGDLHWNDFDLVFPLADLYAGEIS